MVLGIERPPGIDRVADLQQHQRHGGVARVARRLRLRALGERADLLVEVGDGLVDRR